MTHGQCDERIFDAISCGGKGCGTDESKACLRCCRIMLANYAANHGTHCDVQQERLRFKLETLAEQYTATEAELRVAKADLAMVRAPVDNVWLWQGRGDHPESLSCPVVMSAETLRAMAKVVEYATRVVSRGIHRRQDHKHAVDRNVELLPNDIEILGKLAEAVEAAEETP